LPRRQRKGKGEELQAYQKGEVLDRPQKRSTGRGVGPTRSNGPEDRGRLMKKTGRAETSSLYQKEFASRYRAEEGETKKTERE